MRSHKGVRVDEFIDQSCNISQFNAALTLRICLCIPAQSFKEFSQLLNTVEEERRRLVRINFFYIFDFLYFFVPCVSVCA